MPTFIINATVLISASVSGFFDRLVFPPVARWHRVEATTAPRIATHYASDR